MPACWREIPEQQLDPPLGSEEAAFLPFLGLRGTFLSPLWSGSCHEAQSNCQTTEGLLGAVPPALPSRDPWLSQGVQAPPLSPEAGGGGGRKPGRRSEPEAFQTLPCRVVINENLHVLLPGPQPGVWKVGGKRPCEPGPLAA